MLRALKMGAKLNDSIDKVFIVKKMVAKIETKLLKDETNMREVKTTPLKGKTTLKKSETIPLKHKSKWAEPETTLREVKTNMRKGETTPLKHETKLPKAETNLLKTETNLWKDETGEGLAGGGVAYQGGFSAGGRRNAFSWLASPPVTRSRPCLPWVVMCVGRRHWATAKQEGHSY